jgi:hypothetical protein
MRFSIAKATAGDKVFYSVILVSLSLFFLIVLYP